VANPHIFSIVEFLKIHYNLLHNKKQTETKNKGKTDEYNQTAV
jgi:hypothetical protein